MPGAACCGPERHISLPGRAGRCAAACGGGRGPVSLRRAQSVAPVFVAAAAGAGAGSAVDRPFGNAGGGDDRRRWPAGGGARLCAGRSAAAGHRSAGSAPGGVGGAGGWQRVCGARRDVCARRGALGHRPVGTVGNRFGAPQRHRPDHHPAPRTGGGFCRCGAARTPTAFGYARQGRHAKPARAARQCGFQLASTIVWPAYRASVSVSVSGIVSGIVSAAPAPDPGTAGTSIADGTACAGAASTARCRARRRAVKG